MLAKIKTDLNLDAWGSIEWSEGGTYGTCWDEDGPTDIGPDCELTIEEFEDFHNLVIKLKKYLNITNNNNYESSIEKDTRDDYDYYGGCETFKFLKYDTDELIKTMLAELSFKEFTLKEGREILPELFL